MRNILIGIVFALLAGVVLAGCDNKPKASRKNRIERGRNNRPTQVYRRTAPRRRPVVVKTAPTRRRHTVIQAKPVPRPTRRTVPVLRPIHRGRTHRTDRVAPKTTNRSTQPRRRN